MADAHTSGANKPKRGLLSFLPVIAILMIVPVAGWFGLDYFNKKKAGANAPAKSEESKEKTRVLNIPAGLPIPVAEGPMVFVPGDPKNDIPPQIVTTNAFKSPTRPPKPNDITVMFADTTKKKHYAVTQIYLSGDDTEALLGRVNELFTEVKTNELAIEYHWILYEKITNMLSSHLYTQTKIPGFRKLLRSEIIGLSNEVLGSNLVQEVVIPKFITQ